MRTVNGQHQSAITVKNHGEVPASKVTALFTMKNDAIPTRETLSSDGSIISLASDHYFQIWKSVTGY